MLALADIVGITIQRYQAITEVLLETLSYRGVSYTGNRLIAPDTTDRLVLVL